MKPLFLPAVCALLTALAAPVFSQPTSTPAAVKDDPKALADFAARLPQNARLEGTIEATSPSATLRAKLLFQAPDSMLVEIEETGGARPQVIVAAGDETRLYDPATRRVQRLPYNIARQWWRGSSLPFGGPANFVLSTLAPEATGPFYISNAPAAGELALIAQSDEDKTEAPRLVSDSVRFGGGGDRIYYAPFKRLVWNRPAKIALRFPANKPQITREETDDNGQVTTTVITLGADKMPVSAQARDAKNRIIADWKYALAPREEAFPEATFSFDFVPDAILEDARLKAIRDYTLPDVADKFNQGIAFARQAESWPEAFTDWGEAARLAPNATAPFFAIYEASFLTRDLDGAEKALAQLGRLLGADSFEVVWRQASLATAQRDWEKAQSALETAARLRPNDLQVRLALADLLRARGDFAGARSIVLEILKSDGQPNAFKAQAAEMLAFLAPGPQVEDVLAALPGDTTWQKLARAWIELLQGKPATFASDDLDALASWARGLEMAGRYEDAIKIWGSVVDRAAAPTDRNAHLHLMALYALRDDVANSLEQYRELASATTSLRTQGEMQDALVAAWRKSFYQDDLKRILEQRSISTNATDDDARLWLKYQENYGSADEIAAAVNSGVARFNRSAWWRARQAEQIFSKFSLVADPTTSDRISDTQDRIQRDALKAIESAIALDSGQPYYAIQRALILTQRATPISAVIDSNKLAPYRKLASEAHAALLRQWPDDPDVKIAVASQRLALEPNGSHGDSIALLQAALLEGVPDPGEDRHFISFSSRQIILSALRRDKKWDALTPQYAVLFRSARTADEELGVALNYLRLKINRQDMDEIAAMLVEFAGEPWSFEDSQQLMQPLLNVVIQKPAEKGEPILADEVMRALQGIRSPYARLVATYLTADTTRAIKRLSLQNEAPPNIDIMADKAAANLQITLNAITPLAADADHILASRVAALLGEESLNRSAPDDAVPFFTRATTLEPRDVNLRAALATAMLAQGKGSVALALRDDALRALPPTFDTLNRLAKLSYQIALPDDKDNTARLANAAMNLGRTSPETSVGDWQFSALTAARANLDAAQMAAATSLYNGLTGTQWSDMDRAVALIDWETNLRNLDRADQADKVAAQLDALGLSPQERQIAESTWAGLN